MPGLLGKKIGMTSYFVEDGKAIPVTVVEAGPCQIVNVKTKERDGYEALTLGLGKAKEKNLTKPVAAAYKKVNLTPSKHIKEFRNFVISDYEIGKEITVELFESGDKVKVSGRSKGKGFQGVVKRHGFHGVGGATHGQKDRQRHPGSIGQSSWPSRVLKGTRMAGRMGFDNVTVKNLKIIKIIPEKNLILIKGAIPGVNNSIVEINK